MAVPRELRIPVTVHAILIKGDRRCECVIENISVDGIFLTAFRDVDIDFSPGKTIDIEFKTETGKVVNVSCEIMRSEMPDPKGIQYSLGLRLIEIPPEYEEFFKTLYMKEMGTI